MICDRIWWMLSSAKKSWIFSKKQPRRTVHLMQHVLLNVKIAVSFSYNQLFMMSVIAYAMLIGIWITSGPTIDSFAHLWR